MNPKTFFYTTAVIFFLIAVTHALRIIYGWRAAIGGFEAPVWLSWIALVIALVLSYQGFRLTKQS